MSTLQSDVATNSADIASYAAFIDAILATTCTPAGGTVVAGSCWFYGAAGASCNGACSAAGLAYSEATRTYAGSDGTDEGCTKVLQALKAAGLPVPDDPDGMATAEISPGLSLGCVTGDGPTGDWQRDLFPTTASGNDGSVRRACACQ